MRVSDKLLRTFGPKAEENERRTDNTKEGTSKLVLCT